MNVLPNRNFITFGYPLITEDDNRHLLAAFRTFADPRRGQNYLVRRTGKADENQVGTLLLGVVDCICFISGEGHAITIGSQQLLHAITDLVDILDDEDERPCLVIFCQ